MKKLGGDDDVIFVEWCKKLNGQIFENSQVCIETCKLLKAIKPKTMLAKTSTAIVMNSMSSTEMIRR